MCTHTQAEHFDAGVRHWLLQLQTLFGEACAVQALHAIETAANLEVRAWPHRQHPWRRPSRGCADTTTCTCLPASLPACPPTRPPSCA